MSYGKGHPLFEARTVRRVKAGQPVHIDTESMPPDAFISSMYDEQEQDDAMGAMQMLAYALVSLAPVGAAVALAVALAVAITIFNQPN
jgi:hypothetical protein